MTQLSERGRKFSQGQRQLLSIARTIVADPGILMEGRTSFIITHRLSTIRNADQVLVVNG